MAEMDPAPAETPAQIARTWAGRIRRAKQRQQTWHKWWEAARKAYAPEVTESPEGYAESVRTNRIFTIVERKSAELFYQKPDITVAPSALLEALGPQGGEIAATASAVINETLGLEGVQAKGMARRACFDYLLFGLGATKLGVRVFTKDTPTEVPTGEMDPVMGTPMTTIDVVPVPIKTEVFWDNLSPKQFLVPAEWNGVRWDDAPWLGYSFTTSLAEAKRQYGDQIPEDFEGSDGETASQTFEAKDAPDAMPSVESVTATEIWYRTSVFGDEVHPDHLTQIVLIDGIPEPVLHRPSPYQTFDAQGRLTPDSLVGFPLHPLVIRAVTDAAYIASDVAVALPLVQELDKFRTQMVQQREATILRYFHNTDVMPSDALEKAIASPLGGSIGLPGSAFADLSRTIQPMPHGPFPRENFQFNDYIDNDLARTHAIDATSSGTTETSVTATEANLRQANVNVRLGWEQGFVADWFMQGVTKFATLLQRHLPMEDVAAIVGEKRAQVWEAWKTQSPARLSFTMAPDSSLRNDTPLDRKQLQEVYTYLANDPSLNRAYLTQKLLAKYHLDPSQALLPAAQVPQPKPQPPSAAISFKGEDFSPLSPQSPIMLDLWQKLSGVAIDPAAVQNALSLGILAQQAQAAEAAAKAQAKGPDTSQPPHGGKVPQLESLDKHQADETGGMQGSGAMTPGMGGGVM